ncbi:MAG TPA: TetR family transcriptional regulator C-terminal domain-containing protein [Candidatus Obscuribacterales bacterium]
MPKVAVKESTKALLIETGIDIMAEKGYNNTGIAEVLARAGVPKGSFYYYFESKEDFGLQIINTFDEKYVAEWNQVLYDSSLPPLERIAAYIDEIIRRSEARQCGRGCLLANLSQEMADQNELFRQRLREIHLKRRDTYAGVLAEAQQLGQISARIDVVEMAEFFLCAWEGAIMRSKVQKDSKPLHIVRQMFFERLLA